MFCYLKEQGDARAKIFNKANTLISNGYTRVLHSDGYGNFLELEPSAIMEDNLYSIEEYRLSEPYLNTVKYHALATKDFINTRITKQVRESKCIPCKVGCYYVNINDVVVEYDTEKNDENSFSYLNKIGNIINDLFNSKEKLKQEIRLLENNLNDPNFLISRLEKLIKESKNV